MKLSKIYKTVLNDIKAVLDGIDPRQAEDFLEAVSSARRVYVSGSGRSLFVAKSFAQRLHQCGLEAYASGDTNIPPAGSGDILVACSSSGETLYVLCAAERAREAGCRVAAVTSSPSSRLAESADMTVLAPIPPPPENPQPLGSLFEQSALLFFDAVVLLLMEKLGIGGDDLAGRHGNLE